MEQRAAYVGGRPIAEAELQSVGTTLQLLQRRSAQPGAYSQPHDSRPHNSQPHCGGVVLQPLVGLEFTAAAAALTPGPAPQSRCRPGR